MSKNEQVVIYNNDMNLVPLRKFTATEQNLLYSICIKMRDEGQSILKLSFDEIKKMCNYTRKDVTIEDFAKELKSVYSKLLSITCEYTEGRKFKGFVLFTRYEIDIDTQIAEVKVNEDYSYLLNNLTNNFTKFEMLEFSELSSSYSKTAYKHLKQFRKTGYLVFEIDKFKESFCVPNSYQMCDINKRIIQPIQNELSLYFKNLEIHKISKGKGRKITHIEFVFDTEADINATGTGTFRDYNGFYYNKQLLDFTDEEVNKKFKPTAEPMVERYDKKRLEEKEEMRRKYLELFPEDADIFK